MRYTSSTSRSGRTRRSLCVLNSDNTDRTRIIDRDISLDLVVRDDDLDWHYDLVTSASMVTFPLRYVNFLPLGYMISMSQTFTP